MQTEEKNNETKEVEPKEQTLYESIVITQGNLRTDRAKECKSSRVSGGTNFENFTTRRNHGGAFVGSMYLPV